MEILVILEALEDVVDQSVSVPFSNKSLVDKEEVLDIIKEARIKLPDDIKKAKWIMDEHDKIIQDAEKEAERIINDAQSRISSLVDDHEITKRAYDQANDIIMNAQKNSKEIKTGTKHYADDILSKVEQILQETIDIVKVNRTEL